MTSWKPVEGYEGFYEVSDRGDVRSLPRLVKNGAKSFRTTAARILTPIRSGSGYLHVSLCKGKQTFRAIHRLVAEAFLPNPENKTQVNHIDGDRYNNSAENLEWCTALENAAHAWETLVRGEKLRSTLATDKEVRECVALYAGGGWSQKELAARYRVSQSAVSLWVLGKKRGLIIGD